MKFEKGSSVFFLTQRRIFTIYLLQVNAPNFKIEYNLSYAPLRDENWLLTIPIF